MDFSKFAHDILSPLYYTSSEMEFLRRLRFVGGKYSDFAEVLKKLPECQSTLLKIANTMFEGRIKEPLTSVEVALSMMGFVPARNFLAVSLLKKSTTDILPGQPSVSSELSFAIQSEAAGNKAPADYFLAGLVFDLIQSTLAPTEESTVVRAKLEEIWEHGIEVAGVAGQLLAQFFSSNSNFSRDLYIDGILHDIGKIVYPALDPKAFSAEKASPPELPEASWFRESQSYHFPHDALGHLILWRFGFLTDTSWVALYHHQPFLAKRMGQKIYTRTMLIWLADHVVRYKKINRSGFKDDALSKWFDVVEPSLQGCKRSQFDQIIKSVRL